MRAVQPEPATRPPQRAVLGFALATFISFFALNACSSDTPTAPNGEETGTPITFATTHFDIHLYDGMVQADVEAVVDRLEAEHRRIVDDLQVSAMPRVAVGIWANETSFNAAMLALSACGALTPVAGALAHNAGSVLVVLNSARLLRLRIAGC